MRCPAAAIVLVSALASAGAAEPPITIVPPRGWVRSADALGAGGRWESPDGAAALAVAVTPAGSGPAALARSTLEDLRRLCFGFELIDWQYDQAIGTRIWSRFHFRFTIGTRRMEQVLYLTVDGGNALSVSGTATPAAFPRWSPSFQRMLEAASASRPTLR